MKSKIFKIFMTLVVAFSSIGGVFNTINVYAEDEQFDIEANVEYKENNTQADIHFDLSSINERYNIESIKDSQGVTLDLNNLTYSVMDNDTYVFEVNYYEGSKEELLTYSKEVIVSEIKELVVPTPSKEELPQKEVKTQTNSKGDSLKVQFNRDNGSPIDWSDVNQLDWLYYEEEQVEITANFSEKSSSKTRRIEVDIPDGYEVIAYSAKNGTTSQAGETVLTTTEATQQSMASSQLTSQTGGAFGSDGLEGYKNLTNSVFSEKQKSGKITYEFNSEADLIVLTLRLGIDKKLYNYSDTRNLYTDSQGANLAKVSTGQVFEALKVKMTSGAEVFEDTVSANVKGSFDDRDFYLHRGNQFSGVSQTYIENGQSPEITPFGNTGTSNSDSHIRMVNKNSMIKALQDEVVLTYKYPEGATFVGIDETAFMKAGNADIKHFPEERKVVVTYTKIHRYNNIYNYGTPKFILDGDYFSESDSSKQDTAHFSYSLAVKGFEDDGYIVETRSQETVVVDKNKPLEITEHGQLAYNYNANGYNFENAYQFLGSYTVANPSAEAKENLSLDWKMDDVIGAKILRCAIPKDSTLSDIKVYTTANTEGFSIPNMTSSNSIYASGAIIDADKIGLAKDEFITRVTGTISKYPENHYGSSIVGYPGSFTNSGYAVYGCLLKDEIGKHTLNIDGIEKSAQITPTAERMLNIYQVNLDTIKDSYYPGDSIPITSKVSSGYAAYSRNRRVTDNFLQDPTVYIRVPNGFALNESSVKFDYLGDITDKATLTKFEKDGAEIYKYTFDDPFTIMAGYPYKGGTGNYYATEYLNISFDLKVSPSNEGYANLAMKDVLMIEGKGNFTAYDSATVFVRNDDFGLTETGYNLAAANEVVKTSVVKLPELQVLSGIRIKGSGTDFYNYDGTSASVASLSKDKVAEVEVKYINNSPSDFEKANIYFPIPKTGVDHGKCFNNKALIDPIDYPESTPFTWDANLLGEVNVPGFTTKYAIDGSAQTSLVGNDDLAWEAFVPASGWKTYDEVKDHLEDVVFLKFESDNPIAPAAEGSFVFELQADTNSPADEVNYWRTYTGTQISGADKQRWVVGGVLAGSLSVGELHGMVFVDKNQNGVYDVGIDVPYTGSDITLNLSEVNGAISSTPLVIDSNGRFDIDMLKQGNYTISALNTSNTTQKFTTSKALNNNVLENNAVPSNSAHTEARVTNLSIKAVESEKYTNIGIGLVEETGVSYEFEDKIQGNTSLTGKASLTLGATNVDHNGVINAGGFLDHKFAVPTVTLPNGYVHTDWEIYKVDSGVETLLKTVAFDKLAEEDVPAAGPGQSYLIKAKISLPPIVTTTDLNVYVGDDFNLLSHLSDYVVAKDENNNDITLVLAPGLANTEVTQNIPMDSGKYSEAGTYEVTVKVTTSTGSYKVETLKVLVNKSPVVEATHQEYKLEDDILTGVSSNATATWLKATTTVGGTPTVENITPTYAVTSGPTTDFSQSGIYEVTYTATNADQKSGTKKVKVLVLENDVETDSTGELSISAKGFVLENAAASSLDDATAITKGNVQAYKKTYENDILSSIEELTNIEVDANQLAVIQAAPKQGGIYELKYTVKENSKEVFKTVNVVVKGISTSVEDNLALTAKGFTLENADASSLNEAEAIIKGQAKAWLISTGAVVTDITVDAAELQAIKDADVKGGVYDLTYTAQSGTMETSVTIKVIVSGTITPPPTETEDGDELAINAHGFVLDYADAKTLTAEESKIQSGVYAFLVQSQEEVTDITVNVDELKAIQEAPKQGGVYNLSFTAKSGDTTNTVTVKVVVKGVSTSVDDNLVLTAQGFTLENAAAKTLNEAESIAKGQAKALLLSTGAEVTNITVDMAELQAIKDAGVNGGIYDLTYTATSGTMTTSVTVKVVVEGAGTPPPVVTPEGDLLSISAHGFALDYVDAKTLTADEAKVKSEVYAFLVLAQESVTNITVNAEELKAIQEAPKQGGVYDLTFTAKTGNITNSVTIKVVVKGASTSIDNDLALTAQGFTLENATAKTLNEAEAIIKGQAKALLVSTGVEVTDITVDTTELQAIKDAGVNGGIYDLTYTATSGSMTSSVTVKVIVQGTGTPPPVETEDGDELAINAHGFAIEHIEASVLTVEVAKTKSEVYAFLVQAQEEVALVTVNPIQLMMIQSAPKQGGVYDLTFIAQSGDTTNAVTVKVVVKGVSTSIDNDLALTAQGFTLENATAKTLNEAEAIIKGQAKALLVSTGVEVTDITVDATELQAIVETGENGGIYDLTYTATSGSDTVSVTVKVIVEGAGTPPPTETENGDELAISANGFVLENGEAKDLTDNKAKENSDVCAWLVKAQEEVTNISVDAKQLKSIQSASSKGGVYDLTFTAQSGATTNAVTIKVFVKPAGSVTDSSGTYTIDANGFVVNYEDAQKINASKANEMSSSIAYKVIRDTNGAILNIEEVSNEIVVDQAQLKDINATSTSGGIFALAFSVGDQSNVVSIEVPVLVVPKWNQSNGEITIGAEGFVLENADAASLTDSLSVSKANAKAYKTIKDTDGNVISLEDLTTFIKVNKDELKLIQSATKAGGIYDLTYSVTDDQGVTVSKTVKVIVKGTHTPAPEGGSDQLAITANDFTIENTEASGLTVEKAIDKSKAEAWLMKEGTLVEVFVDEKELAEIQNTTSEGGLYPLTLRAVYEIDGKMVEVEITIQVTVNADEGDVLGGNVDNQDELNEMEKANDDVIKTSDPTEIMVYIILLMISLGAIKLRKRKES